MRKRMGYTLEVIGIVLMLAALVNHYALNPRFSPVLHTSTYLAAAGAAVALLGLLMTFLSGRGG